MKSGLEKMICMAFGSAMDTSFGVTRTIGPATIVRGVATERRATCYRIYRGGEVAVAHRYRSPLQLYTRDC